MSRRVLYLLLTAWLIFLQCEGYAQVPTTQPPEKFLKQKDERSFDVDRNGGVNYADIAGSPFWKNDYQNATLFKNDTLVGTARVKLNLFTNEIFFLKKNQELVLSDNGINKIVFASQSDTATFVRSVTNLLFKNRGVNSFVQILNPGKYQLLKYIKKELLTEDSALSANRYVFKESNHYFIKKDEKVEPVKRLNKENVLVHLPHSGQLKEWMEAKELNLEREADIILLLTHYNSKIVTRN